MVRLLRLKYLASFSITQTRTNGAFKRHQVVKSDIYRFIARILIPVVTSKTWVYSTDQQQQQCTMVNNFKLVFFGVGVYAQPSGETSLNGYEYDEYQHVNHMLWRHQISWASFAQFILPVPTYCLQGFAWRWFLHLPMSATLGSPKYMIVWTVRPTANVWTHIHAVQTPQCSINRSVCMPAVHPVHVHFGV